MRTIPKISLLVLVWATVATASTYDYRGVITGVSSNPPAIEFEGVNLHGCTELSALRDEFRPWCVYVLDNRIVPAEVALAPARAFRAYHHVVVQTLTAEADAVEGLVTEAGKDALTVDVLLMAAQGDAPSKDIVRRVKVPLARPATVSPGDRVRVLPARGRMIDALTPEAHGCKFDDASGTEPAADTLSGRLAAAGEVAAAFEGVIKRVTIPDIELWVFRDGQPQVVRIKRDWTTGSLTRDCRPVEVERDLLRKGRRVVYTRISKRGRETDLESRFYGVSVDDGRTEGLIEQVDGDKIVVTTLTADGPAAVTIPLESATVRLDGQPADAGSLKAGMSVVVLEPREQSVTEVGQ
jgi:hypothetical protein